jgi:primosomal protein N' (replication factor Y)
VAAEVERLFPGVRTLRADRDTLTRPQDYTDLYQGFYRGDADVLVGTQMIAKGMDFPKVRLVGVVAADTSLHLPDFRSSERTFQLLVQAGGRSGRGESPGRVVVQTYNPEHYAVALAQTHDYGAFFNQEIEYRRAAGYPPFADLWLLVFESIDEAGAQQVGREVAAELRGRWPDLDVLGPAPAPLRRVRGRYRFHVLIKRAAASGTDARQVAHALKALAAEHRMLSITRDPYFLM